MSKRVATSSRGRWPKLVALALVVGLAFGGGWWAARTVTSTATDSTPPSEPLLAEVVEASVGRSVTYTATIRQPFATVAVNALSGVVTSVAAKDEALNVGDALYVVGATAVRVVQGDVPFWRPLASGAKGTDVAQLQSALIELGYLSAGAADGEFGARTREAVRNWQQDLGVERTGVIDLGELVAVPSLPQALATGEEIYPGAQLSAGTGTISARTGAVLAELILSADQARLIPPAAAVTLTFDEEAWDVIVSDQSEDENGQTVLTLAAPDGGTVCGEDCDIIPAVEELSASALVELSPSVSGPAVPVTAVRTNASGTHVVLEDGSQVTVTVLGSSGGLAVVDGLTVGQTVRLGDLTAPATSSNGDDDGTDG